MREYRLSELYDNVSTNSLSRALLYENGDVLNLHYGDIHLKYSGLLDINKAELPFALKTDYKFKESSRMETGDVIFADAAEDYEGIGKAVEIGQTGDTPSYAGLHTIHLKRRTDNLASGYMGYLSQAYAFRRKVWFIAQGAKVLGISSKELLKQSIVIPNITEQNTIVSRLKAVDQKINLLTKKKEALETYKKGLMQKIFSQELRFKREDGTNYPEWDMINLGDISSISIGEFVIKTKQSDDGQYPVYNGGQTPTGYYDDYNNEGNKIVISARGASAGFVNFQYERYWAGNSCYSVSLTEPTYNIRFFYHYLKAYQRRFTDYQQAANIPSVSKKDVQLFQVKVPCGKEQNRIAEFFDLLDVSIENVERQLIAIHNLKKGLLQQMFV